MISEVLSRFDMTWLPAMSFVLFALVFIGVLYFVFRPKSDSYCDKMANMPLDEKGVNS